MQQFDPNSQKITVTVETKRHVDHSAIDAALESHFSLPQFANQQIAERIQSNHQSSTGEVFKIVTEADKSLTTVYLPPTVRHD